MKYTNEQRATIMNDVSSYTVTWHYSTGGDGDASFPTLEEAMQYADQRRDDAAADSVIEICVIENCRCGDGCELKNWSAEA